MDSLCLHCESRPRVGAGVLCAICDGVLGIRRIYLRRRGWTPAWEQHLLRLTERAKLRLPLFPPEASPPTRV